MANERADERLLNLPSIIGFGRRDGELSVLEFEEKESSAMMLERRVVMRMFRSMDAALMISSADDLIGSVFPIKCRTSVKSIKLE